MTDNDWVTEGTRVAILSKGGYAAARVTMTVIARTTATQIICSNGRRFNRFTLYERGDQWHDHELAPSTDPRVKDALIRQHACDLDSRLRQCYRSVRSVGGVAQYLDDCETAIKATRAAIEKTLEGPL